MKVKCFKLWITLKLIMVVFQKYECSICNSKFSDKYYLKTHEDSIHRNKMFDCNYCGKQFTQSGILTTHINSIHKGIKYKCDQCDKEFTQPSNRNSHIKSVHEQKKYPCTLCDYQATHREILQNIENHFIKVSSIHVQYVDIRHHTVVTLTVIFSQYIKERNISVILVIHSGEWVS